VSRDNSANIYIGVMNTMNDAIPRSDIERVDWDHLDHLLNQDCRMQMIVNGELLHVISFERLNRRKRLNQRFTVTVHETPIEEAGEAQP